MRQPDEPGGLGRFSLLALRPALSDGLPFSGSRVYGSVPVLLSGTRRFLPCVLANDAVHQPDQLQRTAEGLRPFSIQPGDGPLPCGVLLIEDMDHKGPAFTCLLLHAGPMTSFPMFCPLSYTTLVTF